MSRFSLPLRVLAGAALCTLAAAALAAPTSVSTSLSPVVARGVIVTLKSPPAGERETPLAQRERLATVAHDAGLPAGREPMAVGTARHLLHFDQPLTGAALDAALRRVRLNAQVAAVEPDVRLKRRAEPNDPYYTQGIQWHLRTTAAGGPAALNLPPVWSLTTGRASAVVAVVDTGALYGHPDMAGKWLPGYDLISDVDTANDGNGRDADPSDPGDWITAAEASTALYSGCIREDSSWHGTFIAGEIAAATNNGIGVAGVDWQARVLPVRVSGKCGAWLSDVVDGIRWAAGLAVQGAPLNPNPARVINVSFGGSSACTASYQSAIDDAARVGALVVVAGGNENGPLTRPADCAGVLSVGAVRQDGLKTYYSNYGPNLGIMTAGGPGAADSGPSVYSISNAGLRGPGEHIYDYKDGTSFASPLAAGVASLMLSINSGLSPSELVARIQAAARPFPYDANYPTCRVGASTAGPCNCTRETCGPGLLDAERAVALATGPAVSIVPVGQVAPGSTVTLDGRGSLPLAGSQIVSYQWSVASGTPLAIANANTPLASVTLPNAGTWVFRLLVTDSAGRAADNYVSVTADGGDAGGDGGGGGGATGWLWGLGLWLLAGLAWARRRRA